MIMKFKCTLGQRNMLLFAVASGFESPLGCHNIISVGTVVPKGDEGHFNLAFCGTFRSLEIPGYEEMKFLKSSQEMLLFTSSLDLNWPWGEGGGGFCRQNVRKKIKCWMDNQHMAVSYQHPETG
jgi:hypothetical protein